MKTDAFPAAAWRRLLIPLAAALLGCALIFTWITAWAAPAKLPAVADTPAGPDSLEVSNLPLPQNSLTSAAINLTNLTETNNRPAALQASAFDLRINKTQAPSTFRVGTGNIYAISVNRTNTETIDQLVTIEDPLPVGLTWTPINVGRWNCTTTSSTTLVSCFYTENNPLNFDLLQFQVNVPKDVNPTSFDNIASLKVNDADTTNNESKITTTVDSLDLQLSKTVSPTNILTGTISYTFLITNTGPVDASAVKFVDPFSPDLEYIPADTVSTCPGQVFNEATDTFDIGNMARGESCRIVMRFRTLASAAGRVIVNTATLSNSKQNDYNTANNKASATLVVGGLSISKGVTGGTGSSFKVGEPITFTFNVVNPSPDPVTNVEIRDPINSNLVLRRTPNGGTILGGLYTVNLGTINGVTLGNNSRTVRVVFSGSSSISNTVTITNAATVLWGASGSQTQVRSNTVDFTIFPGGSLQVGKTDGLSEVNPGQVITYSISVTNTGNRVVNSIRITDTMGANLTAVTLVPSGLGNGSCPNASTCVLTFSNPLTPGSKATFRLSGKVNNQAPVGTNIVNTIQAIGVDDLSQTIRVTGQDINTVVAAPVFAMSILKTVTPAQARVDENFTFRIEVLNEGTNTVNNVRMSDEFESVVDLTSVTTSRGTGTLNTSTRIVDVNIGDLAPGQGARITIIARVNSTATDIETFENRANVTWTGGSLKSNTVRYRVLPAATLPGTGWEPAWSAPLGMGAAVAAPTLTQIVAGLAFLGGLMLGGMGLLLLAYSLYARRRYPLHAGSYTRAGLIVGVLGGFLAIAGIAMGSLAQPVDELALLSGAKPPLATSSGPLPTRAIRPTATFEAPVDPAIAYLPTPTPMVLPDYPIPTPTAMVAEGPQGIEPDSSPVNRILVPKMGLDTEVKFVPFDGQTWMIGGLRNEVAWMGDTSWPGLGGNTGLAGHVDLSAGDAGPFWNLNDLKPGDEVVIYTQKNRYTYTVREQKVVYDYEMGVLEQTNVPQITLITCTGWDADLRAYIQRLIVYADLKTVEPAGQQTSQ